MLLLDSARDHGLEASVPIQPRSVRFHVEPARRVAAPRHLVVYRLASDGIVEILGSVHDRMVLSRAARKIVRGRDRR